MQLTLKFFLSEVRDESPSATTDKCHISTGNHYKYKKLCADYEEANYE